MVKLHQCLHRLHCCDDWQCQMFQNQNICTAHCLLDKTLPIDLSTVLDMAVDIVNFIKARLLKSCLFSSLCEEMGAEHQSLLGVPTCGGCPLRF